MTPFVFLHIKIVSDKFVFIYKNEFFMNIYWNFDNVAKHVAWWKTRTPILLIMFWKKHVKIYFLAKYKKIISREINTNDPPQIWTTMYKVVQWIKIFLSRWYFTMNLSDWFVPVVLLLSNWYHFKNWVVIRNILTHLISTHTVFYYNLTWEKIFLPNWYPSIKS